MQCRWCECTVTFNRYDRGHIQELAASDTRDEVAMAYWNCPCCQKRNATPLTKPEPSE